MIEPTIAPFRVILWLLMWGCCILIGRSALIMLNCIILDICYRFYTIIFWIWVCVVLWACIYFLWGWKSLLLLSHSRLTLYPCWSSRNSSRLLIHSGYFFIYFERQLFDWEEWVVKCQTLRWIRGCKHTFIYLPIYYFTFASYRICAMFWVSRSLSQIVNA